MPGFGADWLQTGARGSQREGRVMSDQSENGASEMPASSSAPASLAVIPSAAGAAAATCGAACAGACTSPLLGLLGLSTSSAALTSWSAWLRPLFLVISVGALAVAFYRAYRRPRVPAGRPAFIESRRFVWLMALVCLAMFGLPLATQASGGNAASPCARPCPINGGHARSAVPCDPAR
jgi:hypothetical protein